MTWIDLIKWPATVSVAGARMLDALTELVPITRERSDPDGMEAMFRWFRDIDASGLLSRAEMVRLKRILSDAGA